MSFLQDNLIPFMKKRDLLFLESYDEMEGVRTFLFEKEEGLTWKAGQYGLFTITHKSIKNDTRPFSVSSAPSENVVRITTMIKDTPSDFKKALLELNQGMKIRMRGPVGPFYLADHGPTMLIAGGIGITPFRSMLKQIEAGNGDMKQVQLVYLDSTKSYLFKNELERIAQHTSIGITFLDSRNDLHQEFDKFSALHHSNGKYFIAGPKSMVDSISGHLRNQNIPKRNIHKDGFFGY